VTKLRTAQQFFLPSHEGDHSAFQPYALGEIEPRAEDMDGFVEVTLEAAREHLAGKGGDTAAVESVIDNYRNDPAYAEALRAWCLNEARAAWPMGVDTVETVEEGEE
jgi:hypothetical protein